MINFKQVFESVEFEIPTVPDFEFCDTKDIYFKTPEDDYLALIKLNKVDSLLFIINGVKFERGEFGITLEIKNGAVHGRVIDWMEWNDYAEYEQGVLHGYSEYTFQSIFGERGFYKNGKEDGWWEFGDKYVDISYYDNREDFHTLDNYRPGSYAQYIDGVQLNYYWSLDSEFEYKLMAENELGPLTPTYNEFKHHPKTFDWIKQKLINQVKVKVEKGEVYRGNNYSYFSYETYLSLTNLPKLKTPRSQTKELYDYCARSIDYDAIHIQYQNILKSKKLKKENFTDDLINIINDQET